MSEARETVQFVYLGYRVSPRQGTLHHALAEIDPTTNDGRMLDPGPERRELSFPVKRGKGAAPFTAPGSVWTMEATRGEDGTVATVWFHSAKLQGQWANQGDVAFWQTTSRAARQEFEARTEARQAGTKRRDLEALDPIRQAYASANPTQRAFILANAISYITRGTTTKE